MRFQMFETLREFAAEQLSPLDREHLERRHALHFLRLAEEAAPSLTGPDRGEWLGHLAEESENLRAALAWARRAGDGELAFRFGGALWRFWFGHGHLREGRDWLEAALAAYPDAASSARSHALLGAAVLAFYEGDYARARMLAEECLEFFLRGSDDLGIAYSLNVLGAVDLFRGEYRRATERLTKALVHARGLGDRFCMALSHHNLGCVAQMEGDFDRARPLFEDSLAQFRELGHAWGMGLTLNDLGDLCEWKGDHDRADAFFREALALQQEIGHPGGIARALCDLGTVALRRGDLPTAAQRFKESLALRCSEGSRRGVLDCLEGLAEVTFACGEMPGAVRLFGAASVLREALSSPLAHHAAEARKLVLRRLEELLGADTFRATWNAGTALSWEQAAAIAAELSPEPSQST
jgi:tetratricopeptide (TPR) repeat protein